MTIKTIWISFWMTMMYWLGGAFGCAAPQHDVSGPASLTGSSVLPSPESVNAGVVEFEIVATSDLVPSLVGLDRSHWPMVTVAPEAGETKHGVLVFQDMKIDRAKAGPEWVDLKMDLGDIVLPAEDFSRVHRNAVENQIQIMSAVEDARPGNWNSTNRLHMVAQPVKVGADVVSAGIQGVQKIGAGAAGESSPE